MPSSCVPRVQLVLDAMVNESVPRPDGGALQLPSPLTVTVSALRLETFAVMNQYSWLAA